MHHSGFERRYISCISCLAKKFVHVCFTLKIVNCNEFHSDLISLFEKLDKNIEIVNNNQMIAIFVLKHARMV
jgi:hypothetical protein